MREDDNGRVLEDTLKGSRIIHQHVARGRPHKYLDATGITDLERLDFINVAVRRAKMEAVVRRAASRRKLILVLQRRPRRRQRIDVGHVHKARYATGRRRCRLCSEITFVSHARLTEMNLVVNHAGHEIFAGRIDNGYPGSGADRRIDPLDSIATDQHIRVDNLPLIDEAGVDD